jgi:hypothetical protein
MHFERTTLFSAGVLMLIASRAVFGQQAGAPRSGPAAVTAPAAPTITILTAATGVLLRSQGANNASLDLGGVSYFRGASVSGESSRKNSGSFVISTRFALRVDCPGSAPSSMVDVTMTRPDAAASHVIAIDGTTVGSAPQVLAQSMPCGSSGEHRLDVEVPVSTPAGLIGSTVAFVAELRK